MAIHTSSESPLNEGLRYYILREPGHSMVPLVPVDQLPFQLQGVPRQLSHREMSKGRWKFIDETTEPPLLLPTLAPDQANLAQTSAFPPRFFAPDHHVKSEAPSIPAQSPKGNRYRHATPSAAGPPTPAPEGASEMGRSTPSAGPAQSMSVTDTIASVYKQDAQRHAYRAPPPSGIEPDPSKKIYCTHWIWTGECAYTVQGCKYKHEMPPVEKLRELGCKNGVPRWYKEKMAIQSRGPTWMQLRMNQSKDERGRAEAPARREFPDPSKLSSYKQESRESRRRSLNGEVQHARGIFSEQGRDERAETSKSQPLSPIPDLLIDIDDAPAPPCSPQLSQCSTRTTASSTAPASASSASSVSQPASPRPAPAAPSNTQDRKTQSYLRRHSQISWSSDDDDDDNDAVKSAQQLSQRKNGSKKGSKQPPAKATPGKTTGLAKSKHADPGKEPDDAPAKNKATMSPETPSLQTQITALRRRSRALELQGRMAAPDDLLDATPCHAMPVEQRAAL